ncbi:MAG: DUF4350 domain-containing protein [Acidobacteria bacterium]|nr:DUF4350 domain-containing protein [Acidobacteriota bacterium]
MRWPILFALLAAAASGQAPVVLLDAWHNNEVQPHYRWEGTYPGGYSELGKLLTGLGAALRTAREPLTPQVLKDAHCLIVADPDIPAEAADPKYISAEETVAVREWVRAGGRLVLFGNDPGNAEFERFNRLAGEFGIRFLEKKHASAAGVSKLTLQVPPYNAVLAGGGAFYAVDVAPLEITARGAQVLIDESQTPVMVLVTFGRGQVLALGDPWIYNEYIGTRDNRRLAESLFRYLLQPALPKLAPFDAAGVRPGPVAVKADAASVVVTWPDESARTWRAEFSLVRARPLITAISAGGKAIVERAAPVYRCSTGKRRGGWDEFFDHPPAHPDGTRSFRGAFRLTAASARSIGERVELRFDGFEMGHFRGSIRYTFYPGSRLLHQEAVVSTQEPDTAFYYDAGLRLAADADRRAGNNMDSRLVYYDTSGRLRNEPATGPEFTPVKARYRAVAAPLAGGSLAVFPAPHQYFPARDFTTNMGHLWHSAWRGAVALGIRQLPDDNSSFYPWANAPPGTEQRLGVFFLLSEAPAAQALDDVLRYTNRDRFPAVPGHKSVAAHFHFAYTVQAMEKGLNWTPPFEPVLKAMGVDAVVMSDFHGDGHPRDTGDLRLKELEAYFRACRARSGADFLMIPGEEPNVHLGGHWAVTFPKPVYWIMDRPAGAPFRTEDPRLGAVYRVGNEADLLELFRRENAQVYTSHPRSKGSRGYPDAYRSRDFFLDPRFFGSAWKAMNVDYSSPRLGDRALNLLDDMGNWGLRKRVLGEVDVFQLDETHELYAHMNVNYVRLPRLPDFDRYGQVVEAISRGDFFVSTGEVLLPDISIAPAPGGIAVRARIRWTFPLRHAELVWSDGALTHRKLLPLDTTRPFGDSQFNWSVEAKDWKWARFAVWDVAANGAFVNPVWRTEQ